MAILFKNLDRLFAAMNTQKTKDLKSTIWYDLYFRFFLARMSGWEFLLVALPLFLISFFVEVFVCYPGNINIPKAVIAIIVLCESLEFILQLVLCWTRLRKCPAFYRKWGIRIKTLSGIVVVAFKAAEIYSICKLVPNSEPSSALDRWGMFGPRLQKAMKSLLVIIFLNSADRELDFGGNENEIFSGYNARVFGPLINQEERNHVLKLVTRMRGHN
ncbi:uncharacterized protein H6S33_008800 [Morchella sextelata]|uniref:uncharacterized protein n=1 Tax=Morchella sextelata TaxID=1174677 RepID=UPI001D047D41|nr:uncharacterized protein H6S33_008800 [Morchella sextelata]KAH0602461.1 hypothetical protein H6S33_008800 [Morchella sextelata]